MWSWSMRHCLTAFHRVPRVKIKEMRVGSSIPSILRSPEVKPGQRFLHSEMTNTVKVDSSDQVSTASGQSDATPSTSKILERIIAHREEMSLSCCDQTKAKIEALLQLFPMCKATLEQSLITSPELLKFRPERLRTMVETLVEAGDHNIFREEEALSLLAICPDVLKMSKDDLKYSLSSLFSMTSHFLVPWNTVLLSSPQLLQYEPRLVAEHLGRISKYFQEIELFNLLGNNPDLLLESWESIEDKIKFLLHTMNVSIVRISKTKMSLSHPLDFYKLRYEILNRSGNYRHPDPQQKGAKIIEALPNFKKILTERDQVFLKECCPGINMQEFNIFKTLWFMENEEELDTFTREKGYSDIQDEEENEDTEAGQDDLSTGYRSEEIANFRGKKSKRK